MEKKQVRYECVSGYIIGDEGEYYIGEEIESIGAVQSVEDIED